MRIKFWIVSLLIIGIASCLIAKHLRLINISNIISVAAIQAQPYTNQQVDSLKEFAHKNGYNSHLAIFINLQKHSGSYRMFLVDLDSNKILLKGLCCHGMGNSSFDESVKFSNIIGSNCSSKGFYKIGYKYNGKFGTAYKLIGLSSTNSNAFDRFVVLHGHDCVPKYPVAHSICESEGCPTLSPEVLNLLVPYLDTSDKPVLMWIY